MDEEIATRYWCHMCLQIVNPIVEVEIKCPFCQSGFVEEMGSDNSNNNQDHQPDSEFGSDRSLSLWGPVLLGMMGNQRLHPRRFRRAIFDEEEEEEDDDDEGENHDDLDGELESVTMRRRRRRRSSATILQLLQGIRAGMQSESENNENGRDRDRDRERERLILINPFNQTIIVQGSYDGQNQNQNQNQNQTPIGSLGDYFIGPGLDLLLQHLAENDPNRYGTPPAQKEAIEAMPSVKIEENLQCSVCLDDFEIGSEAKEMPCKHKFHSECILPWLELHSSCPVCRYQLPADESKLDNNQRQRESGDGSSEEEGSEESGRRFPIPWPFNGLFSSGGNNSTSTSGSRFGTDEN